MGLMTVDLFITCVNDALFPQTGRAVVTLLERLGHQVAFDPQQTCCGQMHFNSGYQKDARRLIRRFVEVFQDKEAIVAPSGSCVAMVRDLYPKAAEWADDPKLHEQVLEIGKRTFELTEFLTQKLNLEDVGAYYPHRVTYHPACHSLRVLKIGDAPIKLLQNVKGLTLLDLPQADQCCGFGGTFSIKNAETSSAMVQDKVQAILSTGAEVCTAADNSCLMNIAGALARTGKQVKAVHLAEILACTEGAAFA
jgi:L-lactate dehydrogenase complex protein LldE